MRRKTRMRTLDPMVPLVALGRLFVLWMLWMCCVSRARAQGLPDDNFFQQQQHRSPHQQEQQQQQQQHHRQHFYYSRQLPDGEEMTVYFYKNVPQKLFFLVEQDHASLEVIVTPCASTIDLALSRNTLPPQDQQDRDTHKEPDSFLEQTLSIQRNQGAPVALGNWSGETRIFFTDQRARAGMYMLDITSTRSDSYVRVLASLSPALHRVYPALPPDPAVKVKEFGERTFSFSWDDAGQANPGREVEYCLAVSTVRNFRTHCGLIAHAKGDEKPTFTADDSWGFLWEKKRAQDLRRKAKPVKPLAPRKMFEQCVGSKKEFTYKKARHGKTYYADVFVLDKNTNMASAYEGVVVKIPGRGASDKKKSSVQILDGERKTLKLQKDTVRHVVMYEAKQRMALLSFELAVCAGRIAFEVYHNSKVIHQSVARPWKRIRMKNVLPGHYVIKFPRLKRRKSYVSVYATTQPSVLTLPHNMSIKVFDSLTTCSNVTVAWMGTHRKQKYCLYVKEAAHIRSLKRHKCTQMDARPKSERVMCTRYRNRDVSKAVMSHAINQLKPDTQYVVDVYLSKRHSGPVAYKSVKVRTKSSC